MYRTMDFEVETSSKRRRQEMKIDFIEVLFIY